jgi:hypothetical protein
MENRMPELEINRLTPSVLETLVREIDAAIKPIAEKYGLHMRAETFGSHDTQAKWFGYSFTIPVHGSVINRD